MSPLTPRPANSENAATINPARMLNVLPLVPMRRVYEAVLQGGTLLRVTREPCAGVVGPCQASFGSTIDQTDGPALSEHWAMSPAGIAEDVVRTGHDVRDRGEQDGNDDEHADLPCRDVHFFCGLGNDASTTLPPSYCQPHLPAPAQFRGFGR